MTTWTQALDAFERQLHRQQLALVGRGDVPIDLRIDPPDVPMSDTEQVRAIALMQRNDAMLGDTLALIKKSRRESASPYSS